MRKRPVAGSAAEQEALDRYTLSVELCPVPVLLATADGRIALANEALEKLFGYPVGALTGLDLERLVPLSSQARHPELREAFFEHPTNRVMNRGREVHGQRADGSLVPLEISLSTIPMSEGSLVYATVVDITERRMNERRLREALDATASAMVLVAPDGTIELVNSAACELLGGFSAEIVGRNVDSFVPQRHRLKHSVYRQSYLAAPRPRAMTEGHNLFVISLDGRETPVHIALTPVAGVEGQRIMATIVDLTEILAQERELERRNARLEALNGELTQFAYSASHDLRSPLTTIAGLLELCLEDLAAGDTAECRRSIGEALTTARRNIHKVEQVLVLARAGLDPIGEDLVNPVEVASAIWDDLTFEGIEKPAFLITASGPPDLRTERATLVVILQNLLSNACRFQDPAKAYPWIDLRLANHADRLELRICDNGIGIPEAEQPRIFDIFRRSSDSSGHGLGLALVQKHIKRLGGSIALDSSAEGTCFALTIPARS